MTARRAGALDDLITDVRARAGDPAPGDGVKAFSCDIADAGAASAMVEESVRWLGGLDVVVHAAGTATLGRVADLDAADWSRMLATNLVGAATVVSKSLPALRASTARGRPVVALLSTHTVGDPWPSLSAYAATKAALEELARGLRREEPSVRFVTVRVGNTATSFADAWDPARFDDAFAAWVDAGLMRHRVMTADEVAERILAALGDPAAPDEILVRGEEER